MEQLLKEAHLTKQLQVLTESLEVSEQERQEEV